MKLFFSPTSPFVRKVVLCATIRGLAGQIEHVRANPHESPAVLLAANPLSKIPCLVTDDGVALFDSPVICEYLDSLGDAPPLFPEHGARWLALRLQALGDGIMDAAMLARMEGMRPEEEARQAVITRQMGIVSQSLAALEAHPPAEAHLDIGAVTIICALGYLDFRFAALDWRAGHPHLARWFAAITADLPGFTDSIPPG